MIKRSLLFLCCQVICLSTWAQQSPNVRLIGAFEKPTSLTAASLRKLTVVQRSNIRIVSSSGEVRKRFGQVSGVLLSEVLEQAKPKLESPKEKGKYILVAQATDGYTATFAYNEVFNNPSGKDILLVFEEDGKPIEQDGAIVLMSLSDLVTGSRHVKWLSSIELRKL